MQATLLAPRTPPARDGIDLRCCDVMDMLCELPGPPTLIVADPPWSYRNAQNGRAAEHYDLLDLEAIVEHIDGAFHVAADDAYLALWVTFPLLQDWMRAETRWRYLSGGAWAKTGMPGVGYHWRGNAEALLLYARGEPRPCSTDVVLSAHVTSRASTGAPGNSGVLHSRKPVEWQTAWIRSWCPPDGLVVDLYAGLGSVAEAVLLAGEGRRYVGAEIDPERHAQAMALLAQVRA